MKHARLSALILPLILTSCASLTKIPATSAASFCDIARPIQFSRLHDTAETIAAIKEHNAVYDQMCRPA